MKKKVLIILLATSLFLVSCALEEDTPTETKAPKAEKPIAEEEKPIPISFMKIVAIITVILLVLLGILVAIHKKATYG